MEYIKIAHYGEERERIATETEIVIFEKLKAMSGMEDLELVRRSDAYVTAAVGFWDVFRFKYTPKAKWVAFPIIEKGTTKHYIESPDDVDSFGELVKSTIENYKRRAL